MRLFILCLCFTLSLCVKYYHENKIWGEPCLGDNTVASPKKSAQEIVRYSSWLLEQLESYKDEFIQKLEKLESFNEFVETTDWGQTEWLRKFYWYIDEILPKEKKLGQEMPYTYFHNLKPNETMTKIHTAMKFLEGSLYKLFKNNSNEELIKKDVDFGHTVRESIRIIRSIICSMTNYMKHNNFETIMLLDDFLPVKPDYAGKMLRDMFNYFEYIKQLFFELKMSND